MAAAASASELPSTMKAVLADPTEDGKARVKIEDRPVPTPAEGQVLLRVVATGTNRAEIMQAAGKIGPPPGATDIMGLEAAGVVVALGPKAGELMTADGNPPFVGLRAIAILVGGGHAEYAVVPVTALVPVPDSLPLDVAAAMPEQWQTAFQLLFVVGGLPLEPADEPETVLVYAAGSGVGTAALQLLRMTGRRAIAVAGRADKLSKALELGAALAVNYKEDDKWDETIKEAFPAGVNLVLDCVGGSFYAKTASLMAVDGVWVLYGLLGGPKAEGPALGMLLRKRLQLRATTLRARSDEYKAALASRFWFAVMGRVSAKQVEVKPDAEAPLALPPLAPVIADTLDGLESVSEAFERMTRSENLGAYVIRVSDE